ncbi:hypothetical protein EON66_07320, partial [archaeon]
VSMYLRVGAAGSAKEDAHPDVVNALTGAVNPGYKLWSRLNIVDLAGSERQSRTMSAGARLKEAGAINNSLLVLKKCFAVMRANAQVRAATLLLSLSLARARACARLPARSSAATSLWKRRMRVRLEHTCAGLPSSTTTCVRAASGGQDARPVPRLQADAPLCGCIQRPHGGSHVHDHQCRPRCPRL